jgi:hypothetical protein
MISDFCKEKKTIYIKLVVIIRLISESLKPGHLLLITFQETQFENTQKVTLFFDS